jgi:histidinol-phosphate aminotransferase
MPPLRLTRRRFAQVAGGALGSALAAPHLSARAHAAPSRADGPDLVLLNSNENPYGPSPAALAALVDSASRASRYPDAAEEEMITALARAHAVGPERIVLGCGSSEILRQCDAAFLGPARTVVAAEPTFEAVLYYARATQAEAVKVPLTPDFRHDLPAMARACDERTGLVYVCNPNNPTGTLVSGDELESFLTRVPSAATVLVDEAYHHFVEDPGYRSATSMIDRFPNVVVARTFSKVYGLAGMRLGYAVASAERAKALRAHASWSNANAAVLAAARVSLGDEAHVSRQRALLNGTRRRLVAALEADGRRTIPSHANFVMIDAGGDVQPLVDAFAKRRILVGRRFAAMPTWLRVTVGTDAETTAFLEALREILPARPAAA